jgi:hypothetical protein
VRTGGTTKPRVSELSPSPPVQHSSRASQKVPVHVWTAAIDRLLAQSPPGFVSAEEVTKQGEVFGGGGWRVGRGNYPPSSSSSYSSSSSPPEDLGLEGVSSPHALTAAWAALQVHLHCLRTHNHSLWVQLGSRLAVSSGDLV